MLGALLTGIAPSKAGRTDGLTKTPLPLASGYGALVTRASSSIGEGWMR
jgi:hypothetical protein